MSFKLFFRYKSELIFLSSGFITPFVGFVVGLINAKYIPPYEMGVINSVLLIVNYLSFIQLGVFNGLNRNISFYKSKGKNYKVQSMVDTSFITSKVVSIISVSIICVVLGWNMWDGLSSSSNVIYGSYFLLLVIMIFLPRNSHYDVTFKSSQEFSTLGKIVLGENISYLLFSLSTVFWGIWGKLFADANKYVIGFFLRRRYSPFFFKCEQSKEAYRFKQFFHYY